MAISSKRILVIEDDSFLRQLVARKLTGEGYDVVEAADGEIGLKKAKEEKPNLILLDLILPGIDGFEILSLLKQDEKLRSIPVIILSNLGQKEDIERGLRLGATGYLIKAHFTPGEIIDRVRIVLNKT